MLEIKNDFDGLTSRLNTVEERIGELEDRQKLKLKQKKVKTITKHVSSVGNNKQCNVNITGISEVEERKDKYNDNIITKNFPKLMNEVNLQTQREKNNPKQNPY